MPIEAIDLFHVGLAEFDTVFVQLHDGQQSGWGEACLGREPVESAEWAGGAVACLRDFLAPAVLGQSILNGEQLQERIDRFQGNRAAKSALDCAWWDLAAKTHATTVAAMLGGSKSDFAISRTLGVMPSIDALLAEIERHQHTDVVLLLKFRPGWDEQMLRAVRQAYPAIPLAIDCDGGCRLAQRDMLYRLDDFMLRWIEQPFPADDLVAHAMLQDQIRTPICLHQSLTSVERIEQAQDLGSCKAMKIDPALVGGLTPARAMYEAAKADGISLAMAGTYQTTVGRRTHEALATLGGWALPADVPGAIAFPEEEEPSTALLATAIDHVRLGAAIDR